MAAAGSPALVEDSPKEVEHRKALQESQDLVGTHMGQSAGWAAARKGTQRAAGGENLGALVAVAVAGWVLDFVHAVAAGALILEECAGVSPAFQM